MEVFEFTTLMPLAEVQHLILDELANLDMLTYMCISKYHFRRMASRIYEVFDIPWQTHGIKRTLTGTNPLSQTKLEAFRNVKVLRLGSPFLPLQIQYPYIHQEYGISRIFDPSEMLGMFWFLLKQSARIPQGILFPQLKEIHINTRLCTINFWHTAIVNGGYNRPDIVDQSERLWYMIFAAIPESCRVIFHCILRCQWVDFDGAFSPYIAANRLLGPLGKHPEFSIHFHAMTDTPLPIRRSRPPMAPHHVVKWDVYTPYHPKYDDIVTREAGPAFDPAADAREIGPVGDAHERMLNLFWPETMLMPRQIPFSYTTFKATYKVARVLYVADVNRHNQYPSTGDEI
uniref:Uncharacterized protein n=2 Tax=Cryptococcus bacillisporus CA1280 TaxID=1296109 RepID=A0A0D0ULR3_CRYGA|nr:hypothetical protein I312_01259 [Cryptococcus bacillisporus CA1280]